VAYFFCENKQSNASLNTIALARTSHSSAATQLR